MTASPCSCPSELMCQTNIGTKSLAKKMKKAHFPHQLEAKDFCNKVVSSMTEESRSLHLYTTNKCNLNCPHCYMFSGRKNEDELSTDEILKLFQDFRNSGGHNVTLSGGEPTLRADFDLLVKSAFDLGLKVRVLTNGSLLTENRIENISPYLDSIQISIDGFSEISDSAIRGKGHFKKAMSAIDSLITKGVSTSVAITPTLQLLKEHLDEYCTFAGELANILLRFIVFTSVSGHRSHYGGAFIWRRIIDRDVFLFERKVG